MRINSLDGLRGFSISLVLLSHTFMPYTFGGFIGVDIFFVLSGFLITTLLIEEHNQTNKINFKLFYIRRFLRLIPALITVIICFYLYSQYFLEGAQQANAYMAVAGSLFNIANLATAYDWFSMSYLLPTWSLSIEEQFYVVWPLLLLCLLKFAKSQKHLIVYLGLIILLLWINRTFLALNDASIHRLYFGTDTHSDGLFVGCLAALLTEQRHKFNTALLQFMRKWRIFIPILALTFYVCSTIALSKEIRSLYIWYFPLLEMVSAMLISYLYIQKNSRVTFLLSNKYLVWLGSISYGLYLWHWLIFRIIADTGVTGIFIAIYGTMVSIIVASLSFYFLEKPILKVKSENYSSTRKSFFPSQQQKLKTA